MFGKVSRKIFYLGVGAVLLSCSSTQKDSTGMTSQTDHLSSASDGVTASRDVASLKDIKKSFDVFFFKDKVESAASAILKTKNAEVILDNNEAFEKKLDIINGSFKTLDMIYYIFQEDQSTSVASKAILDAVKRGVKVRLLLDYITNYKHLDFLVMLEREAKKVATRNGGLDIRFYNRPTRNIIKDVLYLTTDCGDTPLTSKDCSAIKEQKVEKVLNSYDKTELARLKQDPKFTGYSIPYTNAGTEFSKRFISGLYSKDFATVASSILQGQKLNPKELLKTGSSAGDAKTTKAIKDLLKIYYNSKTGNMFEQIYNKLLLSLAVVRYGEKVETLLTFISNLLPSELRGDSKTRMKDWNYFTEYTHHKLMLSDVDTNEAKVILGGRNLENSYHMDPNPMTNKYIFFDTDLYAELEKSDKGTVELKKSFDELFNYKAMVATLDEVMEHAPNDYVIVSEMKEAEYRGVCATPFIKANPDIAKFSSEDKLAISQCVEKEIFKEMSNLDANRDQRYDLAFDRMNKLAEEYSNYQKTSYTGNLQHLLKTNFTLDEKTLELAYLENLPFYREEEKWYGNMTDEERAEATPTSQKPFVAPENRERTYGGSSFAEYGPGSGKGIHYVLDRALRHICKISANENKERRIIFHNAYVLPTSNLLDTLKDMSDGSLDCSNVRITFVTNSVFTTDLNIVNVFANYVLNRFFTYYRAHKNDKSAKFEYYEYLPLSKDPKKNLSLHSKVTILDEYAFVGSANLDVRSFMMDTNNGFFLQGAKDFTEKYIEYVDGIISDKTLVREVTHDFSDKTFEALIAKDEVLMSMLAEQYDVKRFVTQEQIDQLKAIVKDLLKKAYVNASRIMDNYFKPGEKRDYNEFLKTL